MKKNIIIMVAIFVAAIVLRFLSGSIGQFLDNRKARSGSAPNVLVEQVQEQEVIKSFDAPGRVTAKYQVNILARIEGYLQKSYFKEGDYVKEGQVLFLIEPTQYINTSDMASANVANIKSQLEFAEKQLVRATELVKKDYIAKSKYDEILSHRNALKAQLASANASYKDTQRNYGYTHVKAPVSGKIGIISVTVGNFVTPTSGPLTTINSTDPMYVTFPMNSQDFNSLASADSDNNKNRRLELYFNDGTKYEFDGVQDFQDNKIDETTGTVTLRATFKNPNGQLLHGDFVNVKLYSNNKVKVPVVPVTAVQENQAGKYVYKLDEKNIPQLTYIKINGQYKDYWIISEGVKVGEKVITDGLQKIIPNQPVNVVSAEEMAKIKKAEQVQQEDGDKEE